MTTLFKLTTTFIFLLGLTFFPSSDSLGQSNSIFDIMHYQEVLAMTIEADLASLKGSRRTNDYQTAYLSFEDKNKHLQGWKIKVRTRGKFRRQLCEMPPLKIKFKKAELAVAGLNAFNDMKLVTHCVEDKAAAKKLLMKEYLAYQIYGKLTENSYRTQMVRITYRDIKTGKKSRYWGFLIEDTAQLMNRMQAEKCDCWGAEPSEFQYGTLELMTLFQYMIGNEDFIVKDLRNVKVFRKNGQLIPVPYDFDFSGLVNAPYARASSKYGLISVTDRVYLGNNENLQEIHCSQMLLHIKKQEILHTVLAFKKLDTDTRSEMTAYLESFFDDIDTLNVPKKMRLPQENLGRFVKD